MENKFKWKNRNIFKKKMRFSFLFFYFYLLENEKGWVLNLNIYIRWVYQKRRGGGFGGREQPTWTQNLLGCISKNTSGHANQKSLSTDAHSAIYPSHWSTLRGPDMIGIQQQPHPIQKWITHIHKGGLRDSL